MDHSLARSIFEEIQARPYFLTLSPNATCHDCFTKGKELMQRLAILGYAVRGRIGETYWEPKIFGSEITALSDKEFMPVHFFTEVLIDDSWRILDPSFQPSLADYDLQIGSWEGNECCFEITRLFTKDEQIAYFKQCSYPDYQKRFFEKTYLFGKALNDWFQNRK